MSVSVSARALALGASAALSMLAIACTAISGADALVANGEDENEAPITDGHHASSTSSSSSSGSTTTSSTSSTSSSSGGNELDSHNRADGSAATDAPISSNTDASFDSATTVAPSLSDDFNRADGPNIGNGWMQKVAAKYSLSSGSVLQSGLGDYYNNIVYRQETSADVQVSVDVVYGPNFETDASLHGRMQQASLQMDKLEGYVFYAYRDFAAIEIDTVANEGMQLTSVTLSPQLDAGVTYHMSFRVTGSNPVALEGNITDADGKSVATLTVTDGSADKITAKGMVGFGAGQANGTRWDNFVRTDL